MGGGFVFLTVCVEVSFISLGSGLYDVTSDPIPYTITYHPPH